jgi:hypothetical protein
MRIEGVVSGSPGGPVRRETTSIAPKSSTFKYADRHDVLPHAQSPTELAIPALQPG